MCVAVCFALCMLHCIEDDLPLMDRIHVPLLYFDLCVAVCVAVCVLHCVENDHPLMVQIHLPLLYFPLFFLAFTFRFFCVYRGF